MIRASVFCEKCGIYIGKNSTKYRKKPRNPHLCHDCNLKEKAKSYSFKKGGKKE
jgi:hypothetical protein